ncbi:tRNA1Val (adenine37-N6)-methyltransferase [Wenyingzhuangia heitensis]|uniref:tRNA1(Val) (adenine(37)-N6)-methyltransferase n=1 Tax=Wenyingzhuangia heitensis TaxID=1487859 RepID=A0ABX0UDV9_9FLAO|nr:methyltransferase [Wenyingzhuangia heitensis]NIJ46070.1 tRNA1Val (adenine37-N6)-methyltransferase [Wenyingzhuangia heitensis]
MFQFKQFSITQDKSAMKVGTDGVLLGAWTPVEKATQILDIGTGTGLIALMLAQRNSFSNIDAVEIDISACLEAEENFKSSNWKDRISLFKTSISLFKPTIKYDLIVSNPPYYTDTFKSEKTKRTLARHVDGLSFKTLLSYSKKWLTDKGICTYIIPYKEENDFILLALEMELYLIKQTRVKGRKELEYKRSLLCFSKTPEDCEKKELIIEIDRHIYTEDYIKLTAPFYLKM